MKSPICESGRHSAWAESILPRSGDDPDHPLKLLTFCHSQFAEENWSAAESTTKIQSGDSFEKYYGAMAITWLHELGHLIFQYLFSLLDRLLPNQQLLTRYRGR